MPRTHCMLQASQGPSAQVLGLAAQALFSHWLLGFLPCLSALSLQASDVLAEASVSLSTLQDSPTVSDARHAVACFSCATSGVFATAAAAFSREWGLHLLVEPRNPQLGLKGRRGGDT